MTTETWYMCEQQNQRLIDRNNAITSAKAKLDEAIKVYDIEISEIMYRYWDVERGTN